MKKIIFYTFFDKENSKTGNGWIDGISIDKVDMVGLSEMVEQAVISRNKLNKKVRIVITNIIDQWY